MRKLVRVKQRRTQERNPDRGRGKEAGDFVFLNERQQIVWHGFGGDHIAAANVNGRTKKHIQLCAVVKRQSMQSQIMLCNFRIDNTTHILPKHRIVRQHGAFGHGLRATGVHNLGQVLAGQTRFGQGMGTSRQFVEIVHARDRLTDIFRWQPDKLFDLGFQLRGLLGQFCQATVCGQSFCASMAQDISHFVGLQHEVDGHHHRTHASECKPQCCKTMRVSGQDSHPISRLHTHARKASG